MVKSQALPHAFWLEAIMCVTYVINTCPTKALDIIPSYEAWHGNYLFLLTCVFFNCLEYALVPQ